MNDGFIGWGSLWTFELPEAWYRNLFTAFLGFPAPKFFSGDYFSILPWSFLFLTGYFAYFAVMKSRLQEWLKKGRCRPLAWLGRHSLLVYMLHQSVIYGIIWLAVSFWV